MLTKVKLYKGDVNIEFNSFKHEYWKDGNKVPSVTTILNVINKPALVPWAARMAVEHIAEQLDPDTSYSVSQLTEILKAGQQAHWKKKTDAGKIGSLVHEQIEKIITGERPMKLGDPKAVEAVKRFTDWADEKNVKFRLAEQVVYSKKYNFVGTADFVATLGDKLYLGDIKTSKGIYPEYGAQMAAYLMARIEEFPKENYSGCVLVRVGKDDLDMEVWKIDMDELENYKYVFLSALHLYRALERVK